MKPSAFMASALAGVFLLSSSVSRPTSAQGQEKAQKNVTIRIVGIGGQENDFPRDGSYCFRVPIKGDLYGMEGNYSFNDMALKKIFATGHGEDKKDPYRVQLILESPDKTSAAQLHDSIKQVERAVDPQRQLIIMIDLVRQKKD